MREIPPRRDGETLDEWSNRVMESPYHWWLCLAPTVRGSLCRRNSPCSKHTKGKS